LEFGSFNDGEANNPNIGHETILLWSRACKSLGLITLSTSYSQLGLLAALLTHVDGRQWKLLDGHWISPAEAS
jgi:hypothetical protein